MGSDHRCVMATFTITTPKKDGRSKKKTKMEKKATEGTKLKKTLGMRSQKDTKRSLEKLKKKLKPQTKNRLKAKEKPPKQKKAAQAKSEKAEAEAKKADGEFPEIEVKHDVETAEEADEEHLGHRTANEEAGSIV